MDIKDIRSKLSSAGLDTATLNALDDNQVGKVKRPGTYEGNHFFDLGDQLIWRSGPNGEKCGEDTWFIINRVSGDSATKGGTCKESGLDWYYISLVK